MKDRLLTAKINSEIPLKEIITEQNQNEAVQLLLELNDEFFRAARHREYVLNIIPKTFKNEDSKKTFIDTTCSFWQAISCLTGIDKNGELVTSRNPLLGWCLTHLIKMHGFVEVFGMTITHLSAKVEFGKVDVEQKTIELFVQLLSDETSEIMNTVDATRVFEYGTYSRFCEALNGNSN